MVVEFFGLPGAGKSTLTQGVSDILQLKNIPVERATYDLSHNAAKLERLLRKLFYITVQAWGHPRLTKQAAKAVLATRQTSPRDFFKVLFNWLFVSALMHRNTSCDKIQLLDQGFFQALWSVGLRAGNASWISLMTEPRVAMPLPQLVVVVDTSMRAIKDRLAARGKHASRLKHVDMNENELERLADMQKLILSTLRAKRISTVIVRNEKIEDLPINAASIAERIERLLAPEAP